DRLDGEVHRATGSRRRRAGGAETDGAAGGGPRAGLRPLPRLPGQGQPGLLPPLRALRGRGGASGAPRDAPLQGDHRGRDHPDAGLAGAGVFRFGGGV
ncbi:MAG: hypothetical protein AVDCRST_MAG73-2641, partial [uncultured Thermomicrobiales bacterium]